jgi:hypothetical protein
MFAHQLLQNEQQSLLSEIVLLFSHGQQALQGEV